MSNIGKNRDWSSTVADRLRDAEAPLDDALWRRIEGSLDAGVTGSTQRRIWPLVAGFAAAAAAAAAIGVVFWMPEENAIIDPTQPSAQIAMINNEVAEGENNGEGEGESINNNHVDLATTPFQSEPIARIAVAEEITITEEATLANETTTTEAPKETSTIATTQRPSQPEAMESDERQENNKRQESDEPQERSKYQRYYQEYEVVELPQTKRHTHLAVLYSGGASSSATSISSISQYMMINNELSAYGLATINFEDLYSNSDISHHIPFGIGIRVQQELTQRLLIGSGVNYTRLVSDIDMSGNDKTTKQQIHFVGVPLLLKYRFVTGDRFSLYAGAGGSVEYCVGAKVGSQSIDERDWHYSTEINIGAEYNINEWLGLYFEPGLSHYFTDTYLQSIRNDSPTTFTIKMGLSFTL